MVSGHTWLAILRRLSVSNWFMNSYLRSDRWRARDDAEVAKLNEIGTFSKF